MMRKLVGVLPATALASIMLVGCVTTQEHEMEIAVEEESLKQYLADKPVPAQRLYARVPKEGERNLVLNHMRAGLAAFELGDYDNAERSFDEALVRIEAIYAENEKAEQARSNFVKENIKDFKGEPYERAMAYYYRGLLYMRKNDYENARASFKSAMLQDSFAEDQRYNADLALMAYLEGWTNKCLGQTQAAKDSFEEAVELRSTLTMPSDEDDLLLLADIGPAPRKIAQGDSKELLKFEPATGYAENHALFYVGDEKIRAMQAEDVFWQATTRGGRQVDSILEGKAQFKDEMDTAGTVAMTTGVMATQMGAMSGNRNMAGAGALIMLAGLMAKAASEATRPEADIRQWDNLPSTVHVVTAKMPEDVDEVQAQFLNSENAPISAEMKAVPIHKAGRCGFGIVRSHPATQVPDVAPGAVAGS